jgi:Flp pilus assembly protein CpaB
MKTPFRGYSARRRWLGMRPGVVVAAVLAMALGGLWIGGAIDPLALFRGEKAVSHRGMVAVPVSGMAIPAYTKILRDHLWNAGTGSFAFLYLPPEQVGPSVIRNIGDIIGRVMDHDKPAAYAFTEDDFLPKGTKPGIVAGIPAGKRAMRVPLEKIPGLADLRPGDRFDLVSTLAIDASGSATLNAGGLYGKQLDLQSRLTNWQKQATVRVVVQSGDIVQPTVTRQVPVANTSLTQGLIVRTKPVQEVVIAVKPSEVARLAEALAVGAEISCVPRSGRPEDPWDSVTPESLPVSPYGAPTPAPAPSSAPASGMVTGLTPTPPTRANPFGAGFSSIESISGTKREIIAAPVKR